jgi:hypothetical protein
MGEREFACGLRPEISRLWGIARRADAIRTAFCAAGVGLAVGGGWFLAPWLREAVTLVTYDVPVDDALIPWCYRLVSPVFSAFWFALRVSSMVGRSDWFHHAETEEARLSRIGSPYYLERSSSIDLLGIGHCSRSSVPDDTCDGPPW